MLNTIYEDANRNGSSTRIQKSTAIGINQLGTACTIMQFLFNKINCFHVISNGDMPNSCISRCLHWHELKPI